MKTILKKIIILTFALATLNAVAQTPFYFSMPINGGGYETNAVTFQAWPPTANGFVVFGTNIVYGANIVTNFPNQTSGLFSNALYANTYRVYMPDINAAFFVVIPNTTNYSSLSAYITNAPVSATFPGYVASTWASVSNAISFQPATNNLVYFTNVSLTVTTNGSGNITAMSYTTNVITYQTTK